MDMAALQDNFIIICKPMNGQVTTEQLRTVEFPYGFLKKKMHKTTKRKG